MTQSAVYAEDKGKSPATNGRWEQIGAAGGLVFIGLQVASQILIQAGGSEPPFNATAREIETFFMNQNPQLASVGGFLSVLSLLAFFWFLGTLWAALRRHEEEPAWLSLVAFAFGVAAMTTMFGNGSWELALLRLGEGFSAETTQLLFDQGNFAFAAFWVPLAGMLMATAVVAIRDRALPRWLAWFGLIVALALLAARTIWFTTSGVKFMPYVLFWVWLMAASVVLIRQARHAG